jgi:hypothetical protein
MKASPIMTKRTLLLTLEGDEIDHVRHTIGSLSRADIMGHLGDGPSSEQERIDRSYAIWKTLSAIYTATGAP